MHNREQNAASPIHSIPAELFLHILLDTVDFENNFIPQLHALAQVCTYWFQTIISNSQFWRVIDIDARDLVPVIIKRNPEGPLAIRCLCNDPETVFNDSMYDFIEVAQRQAHRWTSLELAGFVDDRFSLLLDNTTPMLIDLKITNYQAEVTFFSLSVTSTLRHVDVWGTRLPWDSPSLASLLSISIAFPPSGGPSLRQIVGMLSTSPELEWLALQKVTNFPTLVESLPDAPIPLPALRGLYLMQSINPRIANYLLKNIIAEKCRILEAPISFSLIQHPGPSFDKLLRIPMQLANSITASYYGTSMYIEVSYTTLQAGFRPGWRCDSDETRLFLAMEDVPYIAGVLESTMKFLSVPLHNTQVALVLHDDPAVIDPAHSFVDYLAFWDSATTLTLPHRYGQSTSTTALRFLATPMIEGGHARWPCPRLVGVIISIRGGVELADAVIKFLEERSPAKADTAWADTVLHAPVPIQYIEGDKVTTDLIRKSKAAEGIEMRSHPNWW